VVIVTRRCQCFFARMSNLGSGEPVGRAVASGKNLIPL
jgi:hypothetical protein